MPDINLDIGANAREAQRVIADLVRALLGLQRVTRQTAQQREQQRANQETLANLRQQRAAFEAALRFRQQQLETERRLARERVAAAQTEQRQVLATARQIAAAREETAREAVRSNQERLASARRSLAEEIAAQRTAFRQAQQNARERISLEQQAAAELRRRQVDAVANRRNELALEQAAQRESRILFQQRLRDEKQSRDEARKNLRDQTRAEDRAVREQERIVERRRLELQAANKEERKVAADRLRQAEKELATRKLTALEAQEKPGVKAARDSVAASEERIRLLNQQRKVEEEAERDRLARRQQSLRDTKATAAEETKAINDASSKRIQTIKDEAQAAKQGAQDLVATARTKAQSAKDELARSRQSLAEKKTQGRQEIANARESGREVVRSEKVKGDAAVFNAARAVKATKDWIANIRRMGNAIPPVIPPIVNGFRRINQVFDQSRRQISGLEFGLRRLRFWVLQAVTAYSAFRGIRAFIAEGLKFNALIESSRLGIAALITAQADLVDVQGRVLEGTQALAAAQGIAARQLDKLRVAGIQTIATTEELVQTFQETVGAGLNVGLTLDQIRRFSVLIAQAGAAINLPMNQLQQESRSILQSTIDRNSRLAKTLNLTNAMVNQAKAEGRLFDLLIQKFSAFNVAGIESVQTWNALTSNIKDAFAVLAGISTKPLFEDLRTAGQQALARIFDFNTAEIRENFQGLIEGLQILFGQIGEVFRVAIRNAVDKAEDLSKWIRANRAEVQKTAGAVATMVAEFGKMVAAIIQGVGAMLSLGNSTNTVIGAARTLTALFRAIAENVKLIVSLLTAAALFTALRNIVTTIVALRNLGVAAGAATLLGGIPGIGLVLVGITTLITAYKLLKGSQQDVAVETARLGDQFHDQHLRAAELTSQLFALEAEMAKAKPGTKEMIELQKEWATTQEELRALGPQYKKIIDDNSGSITKQKEELLKLVKAQAAHLALVMSTANITLNALKARRAELAKRVPDESKDPFDFVVPKIPGFFAERSKKQLEELDKQIKVVQASADATTAQYLELIRVITKLLAPPELRPHEADAEEVGSRFVEQAKALFERVKAQIEAEEARLDAELAAGRLTPEERDRAQLGLVQMRTAAERELIRAQLEQNRLDQAATGKDKAGRRKLETLKDEAEALRIRLRTLDAEDAKSFAEFQQSRIENARETAEKLLQIEIDFLRASGDVIAAAQKEAILNTSKALRTAIQDSWSQIPADIKEQLNRATTPEEIFKIVQGNLDRLPPPVIKVAVTADFEGRQGVLRAFEEQIKQVEETRNREVEAIMARYKTLGKLTRQQEQDRATEVAAASARASQRVEELRLKLLQLKQEALTQGDQASATFVDTLIAQLDALIAKAQDVDLEMQRLVQGFGEALEHGFADFFESIGDGSKKAKDLFHDMALSIINDMRKIFAELISKRIANAIMQALGLLAGGASAGANPLAIGAGSLPIFGGGFAKGGVVQRRAEGGVARPPHGILRGGTINKDSIPVLAMPNEYFVRQEATNKYGAELFDLFNQMKVPMTWARELLSLMHSHWEPPRIKPRTRFAAGGAVRSAGARPAVAQHVTHMIDINRDGLLTFMGGPVGKGIVLNTVGNAPRFLDSRINRQLKRR